MRPVCRHKVSNSFPTRRASYWMLLLFCASSDAFVREMGHYIRGAWHCPGPFELKATKRISEGNIVRNQMSADPSITKPGEEISKKKRKTARKASAPSRLFGFGMFDHEILTPMEEQRLGKMIRKAIQTKEMIATIIEEKHVQRFEELVKEQEYERRITSPSLLEEFSIRNVYDNEYLEDWSVLGLDVKSLKEVRRSVEDLSRIKIQSTDDNGDDLWTNVYRTPETIDTDSIILSDEDIKTKLGLSGGREEVSRILIEGAMARDKLISSNIRLVLGIARKWCQNTNGRNTPTLYTGSSTRPSLDEAIQEGIIGLATAADRFDYTRKLKFGTYATYWITNSVRNCFQKAATGCLRVPNNYYQIRQQYQKLVKEHYETSGGQPLSIDVASSAMGLPTKRLEFILKTTEPLISLDAPLPNGLVPTQAGKSGAGKNDDSGSVLANNIACTDPVPEERVEMSLLRQCLENAMATELSPHERDVIRLRHGLDDGRSRTTREVSEALTISVSDVRKSESSAFRKLRSPYSVHTFHLLGFLDYVSMDSDPIRTMKDNP